MLRQRKSNYKGRVRTGVNAFPAQHAIACGNAVGLARKSIVENLRVAQARRLAYTAMHA